VIDKNSVPKIADIHSSVMPALRLRGSRKAVVPFEIASTPVSAVVPFEKACSTRKTPAPASASTSWRAGGSCTVPREPVR
jgi:hypothetical protein